MLKRNWVIAAAVLMLLVPASGYAGQGAACSFPAMEPVPAPSAGHVVKAHNLLILADVSRSMNDAGKEDTERAFLTSFNSGIPEGLKNAGLRTFGQSAYYHTVLVQPVESYDRSVLGSHIGDLDAGCGNTPLASALTKALSDLEEATGNIAILVVSDGENVSRDPIAPTIALKEMFGERLCVYTVHVGDSEKGRMTLYELARHGECGMAKTGAELQSKNAMRDFIVAMFYEHKFFDSDGDGVPDNLDRCPNTPKGVEVDSVGCPLDSDGDGVPDYLDKCPNTPKEAKVDSVGCPLDSDGDGVPDYLDKCPDTPAGIPVDGHGCWIAAGLTFDYNKWDIKPKYYTNLDRAVLVLKNNPNMKIEVRGHTDGVGSQAYNQPLSEKRAQAVKNYIVSKGISAERLTVKGMGKLDPAATNDTPEGRAQNRRVEFRIISK